MANSKSSIEKEQILKTLSEIKVTKPLPKSTLHLSLLKKPPWKYSKINPRKKRSKESLSSLTLKKTSPKSVKLETSQPKMTRNMDISWG
jgi:hypothetical protein